MAGGGEENTVQCEGLDANGDACTMTFVYGKHPAHVKVKGIVGYHPSMRCCSVACARRMADRSNRRLIRSLAHDIDSFVVSDLTFFKH